MAEDAHKAIEKLIPGVTNDDLWTKKRSGIFFFSQEGWVVNRSMRHNGFIIFFSMKKKRMNGSFFHSNCD
jgi:hypothetical protein